MATAASSFADYPVAGPSTLHEQPHYAWTHAVVQQEQQGVEGGHSEPWQTSGDLPFHSIRPEPPPTAAYVHAADGHLARHHDALPNGMTSSATSSQEAFDPWSDHGSATSHLVQPSPRLATGRLPSVLDPARSNPSPPPADLMHYHVEPPPWSGGYGSHPASTFAHSSATASRPSRPHLHLGTLPPPFVQGYASQRSSGTMSEPGDASRLAMWPSPSTSSQSPSQPLSASYPSSMSYPSPASGAMSLHSPAFYSSQIAMPSPALSPSAKTKKPVKTKALSMGTSAPMMKSASSGDSSVRGATTIVNPIIAEDGTIQRRGSIRQQIACHSCRSRKSKCDGERPCRHCLRRGTECTYEDAPRRRGPGKKKQLKQAYGSPDPQLDPHVHHLAAHQAAAAAAMRGVVLPYPYAAPNGASHPAGMQSTAFSPHHGSSMSTAMPPSLATVSSQSHGAGDYAKELAATPLQQGQGGQDLPS